MIHADHIPDLELGERPFGCDEGGAEGLQIAAHRQHAAAVAGFTDLSEQTSGVRTALVPPQVRCGSKPLSTEGREVVLAKSSSSPSARRKRRTVPRANFSSREIRQIEYPGARRVSATSIPADQLDSGVLLQPVAERLGLPIREQVDRLAAVHVPEHGAVDTTASEREVVHLLRHRSKWTYPELGIIPSRGG
jgi:hypothetical protein